MKHTSQLILSIFSMVTTGCLSGGQLHDMAESHNARAVELMQSGAHDEARGALEVALEYNPDFAEAHCNLALIEIENGNIDEAEMQLNHAVDLNPDFAEAWTNLAGISLHRGDLAQATLRAQNAVRVDPDYRDARTVLVRILIARDEVEQARIQAFRLLATHPEDVESHALLALVALVANDLAEARNRLLRAEQIDNGSPLVPEVRGRINLATGRARQAAEDFRIALSERPRSIDLHYLRGVALIQDEQLHDARAHFDAILSVQPHHAHALAARGLIEAAHGRTVQAQGFLARALQHHPNLPEALEICRHIDGGCPVSEEL